ncbi:hypothetical protein [Achromobacter xylosoxidans]|uniref:hypothetical protein n=1 Tax=Alcaligenes xylosoxydans xylosoxydans TaxID=85698 RepID=UPI0006C19AE2|nr:hypothetical protein [Achromobacter xylosoxidans]MCZ8441703.1 hypothetical protein [Achromobacter xylosoxidans]MDC6160403.1 hypothetical protein [Achromobacter xylosoxidans]CUI49014.1 Uncharacterised protein [Achromobacter xylosoxidans]CUK06587.1 Uncharacterised protein [Achromobacter xylosoxidans]CUR68868.1 hypothetical protein BN2877_43050 [Achromobacter xylosoxidans]
MPAGSGSRPLADRLISVPKLVATHRPDGLSWQGSRAPSGDRARLLRLARRIEAGMVILVGGRGAAHPSPQLIPPSCWRS